SPGPLDGIDAFIVAAAAGEDVPFPSRAAACIDRQDDGLGAEFAAQLGDQLGAADGGGVDADLDGAGVEDAARVGDILESAAERQGNEVLARGAGDDVDHGLTIVAGCGDVEEYQLVSALIVVAGGELDGIAGVAQAYEVDALYDAAAGYVEA